MTPSGIEHPTFRLVVQCHVPPSKHVEEEEEEEEEDDDDNNNM